MKLATTEPAASSLMTWAARCTHLAQLMARSHSRSMRSGREWLLPVALSRPAKMMGSRAPSISGRATCPSQVGRFRKHDLNPEPSALDHNLHDNLGLRRVHGRQITGGEHERLQSSGSVLQGCLSEPVVLDQACSGSG